MQQRTTTRDFVVAVQRATVSQSTPNIQNGLGAVFVRNIWAGSAPPPEFKVTTIHNFSLAHGKVLKLPLHPCRKDFAVGPPRLCRGSMTPPPLTSTGGKKVAKGFKLRTTNPCSFWQITRIFRSLPQKLRCLFFQVNLSTCLWKTGTILPKRVLKQKVK